MTGYGRGGAALGAGQVIVEVRTVNHRFLELRMHAGPELCAHAPAVEACVRRHVTRGRVDVSMRITGSGPGAVVLDKPRARAAFAALCELRDELAPSEEVPLSLLAHVPGLFREADTGSDARQEQASVVAAEAACQQLREMREAEGERLADDLRARQGRLAEQLGALARTLPEVVQGQRDKLSGRIANLLASVQVPLDETRLEHEIALMADRADVSEELTRLQAHLAAIDALLRADPSEAVGHRLDFLLQEMGRETNTAAAKLPDAAATQLLLEVKAELLRMREQVQNVL